MWRLSLLLTLFVAWETGLKYTSIVCCLSQADTSSSHTGAVTQENNIVNTAGQTRDRVNQNEVTVLKTNYRKSPILQRPVLWSMYKRKQLKDPKFQTDGKKEDQHLLFKAGQSKEIKPPALKVFHYSQNNSGFRTDQTRYKQIPHSSLYSIWYNQIRKLNKDNWFWEYEDERSLYNTSREDLLGKNKRNMERNTRGREWRSSEKLRLQKRRDTKTQNWKDEEIRRQREVEVWNWRMGEIWRRRETKNRMAQTWKDGRIRRSSERIWKKRKVGFETRNFGRLEKRVVGAHGPEKKTAVWQGSASRVIGIQGKRDVWARQKKEEPEFQKSIMRELYASKMGIESGYREVVAAPRSKRRSARVQIMNGEWSRNKRESGAQKEAVGSHEWNKTNCDILLQLAMDVVRSFRLSYVIVYTSSTNHRAQELKLARSLSKQPEVTWDVAPCPTFPASSHLHAYSSFQGLILLICDFKQLIHLMQKAGSSEEVRRDVWLIATPGVHTMLTKPHYNITVPIDSQVMVVEKWGDDPFVLQELWTPGAGVALRSSPVATWIHTTPPPHTVGRCWQKAGGSTDKQKEVRCRERQKEERMVNLHEDIHVQKERKVATIQKEWRWVSRHSEENNMYQQAETATEGRLRMTTVYKYDRRDLTGVHFVVTTVHVSKTTRFLGKP
ncbi:hypothetical protein Pmani_028434 [Petrolisthes manimaculis]|uniref:Uncharacterized protein n=1 Tax=Petrolisthes manimaculis TaxID=1843537 RepID=A0AAE1P058_9EUCA|nr:hypothetical protein Pmani_028434 [Petrolisthes manimaculis]